MADTGAPPIDMSLMAPRPERLEQLAQEIYQSDHPTLAPSAKVELYKIAQMEQLVSAVGVLAQFCAGSR